jgi:pimeloyl-ACP methyl ester carboxylesterase
VIAPCLRGFGYSSQKNEVKDINELALDLKEFMETVLRIKQFYIVGHSYGVMPA